MAALGRKDWNIEIILMQFHYFLSIKILIYIHCINKMRLSRMITFGKRFVETFISWLVSNLLTQKDVKDVKTDGPDKLLHLESSYKAFPIRKSLHPSIYYIVFVEIMHLKYTFCANLTPFCVSVIYLTLKPFLCLCRPYPFLIIRRFESMYGWNNVSQDFQYCLQWLSGYGVSLSTQGSWVRDLLVPRPCFIIYLYSTG